LQTVETTITYATNGPDKDLYKDTLGKYCVTKEQWCAQPDNPPEDWVDAWTVISRTWAKYAAEQTTLATHKGGPSVTSFFSTIEEPILKQSKVAINVDNSFKPGSK
jgi:hypothetical protein